MTNSSQSEPSYKLSPIMSNPKLAPRMAKLLAANHAAAITALAWKCEVFPLGTPEDNFDRNQKQAVRDELADKKAAIERMAEENRRLKTIQEENAKSSQEKDAEIEALKARLAKMGEKV